MTAPAIEDLLRELTPQVLGALVRRHGQLEGCEDAVQEAILAATVQWPAQGVPDNPRGWLVTVASRRLIDQVRSDHARREREWAMASEVVPEVIPDEDDTLVLLFMCCHPALTAASQTALTLRAAGGLTTAEIARAFLGPAQTRPRERIVALTALATKKPVLSKGARLLHQLAPGEHRGDQVQQRPVEVVVGDQDIPVIQAQMVDRGAGDRPVGRWGSQGACHELLPAAGLAAASGVNAAAPHGAVPLDLGHLGSHEPCAVPCRRCRAVASWRGCQGHPSAPGASPGLRRPGGGPVPVPWPEVVSAGPGASVSLPAGSSLPGVPRA